MSTGSTALTLLLGAAVVLTMATLFVFVLLRLLDERRELADVWRLQATQFQIASGLGYPAAATERDLPSAGPLNGGRSEARWGAAEAGEPAAG